MPRTKSLSALSGMERACMVALANVIDALVEFRDEFVLVGGWAPYLLLTKHGGTGWQHVGSADLDFVFNRGLDMRQRNRIFAALKALGCVERSYENMPDVAVPFSYLMPVRFGRTTARVQVDLIGLDDLSGDRDEWKSQLDLALRSAESVSIKSGARDFDVRVGSATAIFAMKAIALSERRENKDAYDMYVLCRHYKGGVGALAEELKPLIVGPPVRRALMSIRSWFAEPTSRGPQAVVDFLLSDAPPAQQVELRRSVHATFQQLLTALGDVPTRQ